MRVLFATGERYLPGVLGGAELSVDELARELASRGHDCEVVAKVGDGAARLHHRVWRVLARPSRAGRRDLANGYPTYRALRGDVRAALAERLRDARPDVVLAWNAQAGALVSDAAAAGVRAILWLPDLTPRPEVDASPPPLEVQVAGVSEFVARRTRERLGRPVGVLRPLVRLERYRATVRRPEFVTLVNPQAVKGLDVALAVATRLPSRRFLFVVPRGFPPKLRAALRAALPAHRNIEVVGPGPDMREVYGRTAVLLVPSQCEDASPRVVLEAQANGIPVVASEVGGIPEVSGGASVLLPPDASPERWSEAVDRLLTDPVAREDASRRSLACAARPEFGPDAIADAFLRLAGAEARVIEAGRPPPPPPRAAGGP